MCNMCNKRNCVCNSDPCNRCQPEPCGCKINLSSLCVVYQGKDLDNLNITQGDRLEGILGIIDSYLGNLYDMISNGFIGVNVGGGQHIYKGLNEDGDSELRTLKGTSSIDVFTNVDTIDFSVNQLWIDSIINPIISSLTQIENRVTVLENTVTQHTTSITNINNQISGLVTHEVFSEEFKGQIIVPLTRNPTGIINVFFDGCVLPNDAWVFQQPNQVALQVSVYGLTVEADDVIRVEYKV